MQLKILMEVGLLASALTLLIPIVLASKMLMINQIHHAGTALKTQPIIGVLQQLLQVCLVVPHTPLFNNLLLLILIKIYVHSLYIIPISQLCSRMPAKSWAMSLHNLKV